MKYSYLSFNQYINASIACRLCTCYLPPSYQVRSMFVPSSFFFPRYRNERGTNLVRRKCGHNTTCNRSEILFYCIKLLKYAFPCKTGAGAARTFLQIFYLPQVAKVSGAYLSFALLAVARYLLRDVGDIMMGMW